MSPPEPWDLPEVRVGASDDLQEMLDVLAAGIRSHPEAAQSIYASLVAEGQRVARTHRGAALVARLRHRQALHRVSVVMESLGLRRSQQGAVRAGDALDALMTVASSAQRDQWLNRRAGEGDEG